VPPLGKRGRRGRRTAAIFKKKRETVKLTTSQQAIQEIPISKKRRNSKEGNKTPGISKTKAQNYCKKGGK